MEDRQYYNKMDLGDVLVWEPFKPGEKMKSRGVQ